MVPLSAFKFTYLTVVLAGFTASAVSAPLKIESTQSKIDVAVTCTIDSFVGQLTNYVAAIEIPKSAPRPTQADVRFEFADLKTGDADRDDAMLKWLHYDSHRNATFHLTGWKTTDDVPLATGTLTIHGVGTDVEFPVKIEHTENRWTLDGTVAIDYRDFKLPKIRKALFLTVNPNLKVHFHLEGLLPKAGQG